MKKTLAVALAFAMQFNAFGINANIFKIPSVIID